VEFASCPQELRVLDFRRTSILFVVACLLGAEGLVFEAWKPKNLDQYVFLIPDP
jgi:hypothetical protein